MGGGVPGFSSKLTLTLTLTLTLLGVHGTSSRAQRPPRVRALTTLAACGSRPPVPRFSKRARASLAPGPEPRGGKGRSAPCREGWSGSLILALEPGEFGLCVGEQLDDMATVHLLLGRMSHLQAGFRSGFGSSLNRGSGFTAPCSSPRSFKRVLNLVFSTLEA